VVRDVRHGVQRQELRLLFVRSMPRERLWNRRLLPTQYVFGESRRATQTLSRAISQPLDFVARPRTWQQPKRARQRSSNGLPRRPTDSTVILYGWHTVKAALENPARHIRRLLATENAARRLAESEVALRTTPEIVRPDAIAQRLSPDAVHNGLLAEADPLPSPDLDEIAETGIVLVLDQITDPHNVGAILRTAAAFAATAIVTTARHSPEATGVLAKSASGALEDVPLVMVQNLARALEALRERGYLLVGLDSSGETDLGAVALRSPLALVLGAEGKGLRQLTRATCDHVARLDLPGRITSLNVSNAATLALYIAAKHMR
jgi:23S rRNA (guanosine2251-2'-O)-methyltransferase